MEPRSKSFCAVPFLVRAFRWFGTITTGLDCFKSIDVAAENNKSLRPAVRFVKIADDEAGQRIDNYLHRTLKGVPRSRVYRILRRGEVRINGGRVRAQYKLQPGDVVRLPPIRTSLSKGDPRLDTLLIRRLEEGLLFEDAALLVLDKPAGLAAHGGSGLSYGAIEALRALRPELEYLELVHRLDRGTSGCLLVAKRRSELRRLQELFRNGEVSKRYLALVQGMWQQGTKRVDLPLVTHRRQNGERTVVVDDSGKPSVSTFRPVQVFSDASLIEVSIATGRTHQIRVHAAALDHPVAGDGRYGGVRFNKHMAGLGLTRLFLHAQALELERANGPFSVSAPLPAELRDVLTRLESRR